MSSTLCIVKDLDTPVLAERSSMAAKPTIVITGGAGFLGSHMADKYLKSGYRVVAVDNFTTGSKRNIEHLAENPDFTLVEHDICKPLPDSVTKRDVSIIA